jgi:predicted nuclease with TOPRIM domain
VDDVSEWRQTMSDEQKSMKPLGVPLASLGGLMDLKSYQEAQEAHWKSYGCRENWEEFKKMTRQIVRLESQSAAQQERIDALEKENKALMQEWTERTKDEVN